MTLPTIDLAGAGWPEWVQVAVAIALVLAVLAASVAFLHLATWIVFGHRVRMLAAAAAVGLLLQSDAVSLAGAVEWLEAQWADGLRGRLAVVVLAVWPLWVAAVAAARPRRRPVVRREPSLVTPAQRGPHLHGGFLPTP
ncbi:hypothetical protein [uncultured Nocardioides sp.]|uniref:hypothetical protein n=1 Tax=uncultured Nocardioides sp. TaxID=198441 RepID=UPI0025F3808A|nr:hypothetical protein [uncultured Nocardioides sp.]